MSTGFEDGGDRQPLEAEKGKETDAPPEPPENSPADPLILAPKAHVRLPTSRTVTCLEYVPKAILLSLH